MASQDRFELQLRRLRQEVFGVETSPFRSDAEAAQWLRSESALGRSPDFLQRAECAKATFNELYQLLAAKKVLFPFGISVTVGIKQHLVAYPGEDRWTYRVLATTEQLVRLAVASAEIARTCRCSDATATMAILVGSPIGRRIRLTRSLIVNAAGFSRSATIETNDDLSLTSAEVSAVWRDFAGDLSAKDRRFLEVIEALRSRGLDPPEPGRRGVRSGVQDYWEAFTGEWNSRTGDAGEWRYEHWTSAQDHWQAVQSRVNKHRRQGSFAVPGL